MKLEPSVYSLIVSTFEIGGVSHVDTLRTPHQPQVPYSGHPSSALSQVPACTLCFEPCNPHLASPDSSHPVASYLDFPPPVTPFGIMTHLPSLPRLGFSFSLDGCLSDFRRLCFTQCSCHVLPSGPQGLGGEMRGYPLPFPRHSFICKKCRQAHIAHLGQLLRKKG